MKKQKSNTETPIVELLTLYGSAFLLFIFWVQRLEHRGGGFILETTLDTRIVISLVVFIFGFMSVYKIVKYRLK